MNGIFWFTLLSDHSKGDLSEDVNNNAAVYVGGTPVNIPTSVCCSQIMFELF